MRLEHLLSGAGRHGVHGPWVIRHGAFGSCYSHSIAFGGLAQLARAPALQAGGQRFESVILHSGKKEYIDILEAKSGSCPDKFIGEPVKSKDTGTATTKRANQKQQESRATGGRAQAAGLKSYAAKAAAACGRRLKGDSRCFIGNEKRKGEKGT